MKKSIYKITVWISIISVAIIYYSIDNNSTSLTKRTFYGDSVEFVVDENNERNNLYQENYASKIEQQSFEIPGTGDSYTSSTDNNVNTGFNQSLASNSNLSIEQGSEFFENRSEDEISNDALAKGGPNNSFQNLDNGQSKTINNNNFTPTNSGVTQNTGVASTPNNAAGTSSPTVVTAPVGPSGGGGVGGDPFVPIDDYYGLIFLLITSTLVGIFTLRKMKTV